MTTEVTMVLETLESSREGSKRKHANGGDVAVPCTDDDELSNGDLNSASGVSSVSQKPWLYSLMNFIGFLDSVTW